MQQYSGKKLLIIGAGHEQVPAIRAAQKLGLTVLTSDFNASAPGAKIADFFGLISTADKQANYEFAKQHQVDGVMTLSSELAVPVVAYVADKLGLNSGLTENIAYKATNKNAMHEVFSKNNVACPQGAKVQKLEQVLEFIEVNGFPVVIKPSDSSGQKGIGIYFDEPPLAQAIVEAIKYSTDGTALVEEFIEGPEINVTAAVIGGEAHILSLSHRVTAAPPHFGIAIAHKSPLEISADLQQDVIKVAKQAIKSIGLQNGIAYPQIIASADKGARILEIAARIPGGYMREVALLQSGVDMIEVAIDQALGIQTLFSDYQKYPPHKAVFVRFLTELDYPGLQNVKRVEGFSGRIETQAEYLSECRLELGQPLPSLTTSSARFGAVICAGETASEVETKVQKVLDRVVVT